MEKEPEIIKEKEFHSDNLNSKENIDKFLYWERKLLDLSLRNTLINFRFNKSSISLLTTDIHTLEDIVSTGKKFQVLEKPSEYTVPQDFIPEHLSKPEKIQEFITVEAEKQRLYSLYDEEELANSLKKIYKISKSAIEEMGSNTLYLGLGLLHWYEDKKNTVPRYAPLILLPLEMERKKISSGYIFRIRDEEILLNTTLFEYLKQNFGVLIPVLQELPNDEKGLDTHMLFTMIREAVADMQGWDIVEAAVISNFSFSQFVMWKDLHDNRDIIEKHSLVRSLTSGILEESLRTGVHQQNILTGHSVSKEADSGEEGFYIPVPLDASQKKAVRMVSRGESFVLHGPPGTGKSQTITAMIADAVGKGKSVLFVAEKKAALDVVKKRLEALGIGDFCLELHANKIGKKVILEQFKKVLDLQENIVLEETDYERKIGELAAVKKKLDDYAHALHKRRSFGKSIRELIDLYESVEAVGKEIPFDKDFIRNLTQEDMNIHKSALERLVASFRSIDITVVPILKSVRQREYNQSIKLDLEHTLEEYHRVAQSFGNELATVCSNIGMGDVVSEVEKENAFALIRAAHFVVHLPSFLRNPDTMDAVLVPLFLYLEKERKVKEKKQILSGIWHESFLTMDMQGYKERYAQANKKFFLKKKAIAHIDAEILSFAVSEPDRSRIPLYLTEIEDFQRSVEDKEKSFMAMAADQQAVLYRYPDRKSLEAYQKEIKDNLSLLSQHLFAVKTSALGEGILRNLANLYQDLEVFLSWEAKLGAILDWRFEDTEESWLLQRLHLVEELQRSPSLLKNWILYQRDVYECEALGLSSVCRLCESGFSGEDILSIYLKSIYKAIIHYSVEEEEVLNTFIGTVFQEVIAKFKSLDVELQDITKKEIYYKLVSRIPKITTSVQMAKELAILRKAVVGNGRGVSVRGLLQQMDSLLRRIKPCVLMSPLSVSHYLTLEQEPFDVLIFDEASQLQTAKVIGVLARAKTCIVVGDPNQMPPTSFFANQSIDEEHLELEDLESILDDTLALGMPQTHLRWHYRSRHESLIAFSNREFYDNSMRTFPSANDLEKKVAYIKVDGQFGRGKTRTNEAEAKAVVEEVKRRYTDETRKSDSIGIITFNIQQQNLIEELLAKEFQKDENFDIWANEREESLFVKNLENVQGDERDVILFSIAFTPDEDGKLSLNFGPLNKEGGYRRLNVVITRARQEMLIFTALSSEMIDIRRTKSRGVEALRNFLEFAQRGSSLTEYTSGNVISTDGIAQSICKALEEAGYTCRRSLGHSDFKLDIAVKHITEDRYILGILLDGESYRKTEETRDREVAGMSILSELGWQIHRVWAMDFWDNKEKEIEKVLRLLETLHHDIQSKEGNI